MPENFTNLDAHVASSALRPGAVMGSPADGLVNFVYSLDDIARGEVAGYNSRFVGGHRQLFPRLSKTDYEQLLLANLPEVEQGLQMMLSNLTHLTASDRAAYLLTRKLVKQTLPTGEVRLIIVPRVPDAMSEVDLLSKEEGQPTAEPVDLTLTPEALAARPKSRKYSLAQILTDHMILGKYDLSLRAVETAKRIAATDPGAASALFQSMMNTSQTEVAVRVIAGDYSRDRVQARNAIRQLCRSSPRTDVSVESYVMFDKLVMFGPDGPKDWHVMGPLKSATEISYIYWLVRNEGFVYPSILLAMELVLLGIDVYDGVSSAQPAVTYHASSAGGMSPRIGLAEETTSMLSASQRMQIESLRDRLLPVMSHPDSGSQQLATAVRVTGRYVLVNSHVMESDPNCTIDDQPVVLKSQLSRDLWSARAAGEASPWQLREPRVGELAVVCYLGGDVLSCSAPLKITSVDSSCVVTMLDPTVTYGMSGGALVALEDMCLLGVHSASTRTNLIAYRFGDKQFAELLDSDSVTTFSRNDELGSFAHKTIAHFKKRGLWNVFQSAADSLEPVYHADGQQLGMAARNGAHLYTTCDAELPLRVGVKKSTVEFETVNENVFRTESMVPGATPVFRRAPNYYEKVFILGFGTEAYMSAETTVLHIGPNSRNFIVADLPSLDRPVLGGLVMGWDGAVLGLCGPRSMTTAVGLGFTCWPLIREELPLPTEPRALLTQAFPFLNIAAWSDDLLEETFTHSSVGRYSSGKFFNAGAKPLASVGTDIAKAELHKYLRDACVPHGQWVHALQSIQSSPAMAEKAWQFGYARALSVGIGVSVQRDSRVYADLTAALIGAASLMERAEVVTQLCNCMAILGVSERPKFARSASEADTTSTYSFINVDSGG